MSIDRSMCFFRGQKEFSAELRRMKPIGRKLVGVGSWASVIDCQLLTGALALGHIIKLR
jgi:hypothetical protein